MNALEFACFFHRLQATIGISIDSNIIELIYDEYCNTYYEKYTLFELIDMLDYRRIPIDGNCLLNKKAIIAMIREKGLAIPDKSWFDKDSKTTWFVYVTCEKNDFLKYTSKSLQSCEIFQQQQKVICIKKMKTDLEISRHDVFEIDGENYEIFDILSNKVIIYHSNSDTTEVMLIDKFIQLIDNSDTTIIRNSLRNDLMYSGCARYRMY